MPKFVVDVKAFAQIELEAKDFAEARLRADEYVEGIVTRADEDIVCASGFAVDGTSEVQKLCTQCDEAIDDPELAESEPEICWLCSPEPEEPPLDTPSLDTSFHDHEMDV